MNLPPLTYLTFDSLADGVGASQVLPYVERLARRGLDVTVHSFEPAVPSAALRRRLSTTGAKWRPHRFGPGGSVMGLGRVFAGAAWIRNAELVHARSDLAAAACLLARPQAWVWDVRSFWADQRIALGLLHQGSSQERVLRRVEAASASSAGAIVTLTEAAIDELADRHGPGVRSRARVISTCVDLDRFAARPLPPAPITLLLSGTFNALYDRAATFGFIEAVQRRRPATVSLLRPDPSPWDDDVRRLGGAVGAATSAEMPARTAAAHAGLSICRSDNRLAITAAAPTKVAEFLATGRPVVVNAGLGDFDALLAEHRCGVVVRPGGEGVERAADRLVALLDDPETPGRCRHLAEQRFNLDTAVNALAGAYHQAVG